MGFGLGGCNANFEVVRLLLSLSFDAERHGRDLARDTLCNFVDYSLFDSSFEGEKVMLSFVKSCEEWEFLVFAGR